MRRRPRLPKPPVGPLEAAARGRSFTLFCQFRWRTGTAIGVPCPSAPSTRPAAREIAEAARAAGCVLLLPMDVVCATSLDEGAGATVRGLDAVGQGEKIFDAGPQIVQRLRSAMAASATVVWNGPLGVFEVPPFNTIGGSRLTKKLHHSHG